MRSGYLSRLFDVLELLVQGPKTAPELAVITGYKRDTIRGYLLLAVQHGIAYVHEVRPPPEHGGRPVHVYAIRVRSSHDAKQEPAS